MNIKISLIDNDYVVQAKTDIIPNGQDDTFRNFLEQIKEKLVAGTTAYLEIEDPKKDSVTLEASQAVRLYRFPSFQFHGNSTGTI